MIYYWYISTVNPHGLSNGARVRVQNTGIPAIDDKDFAAEVVSETKICLLKLSKSISTHTVKYTIIQ